MPAPTLRTYNGGRIDAPHVFTNIIGERVILVPNPGGEGPSLPMTFIRDLETLHSYLKAGGRLWGLLGYLSQVNVNDRKSEVQRALRGFALPEDSRVFGGDGYLYLRGEEILLFHGIRELARYFHRSHCNGCELYVPEDTVTSNNYGDYCRDCLARFRNCSICDERTPENQVRTVSTRPGPVCRACSNNFHYCDSCEEHHETRWCPNVSLDEIQDHGFAPEIKPIGDLSASKYPFYIGMELELSTERPQETLKAIRRVHKDLFWGVYDGSVSGVEMVSQPATFEYWRDLELSIPSYVRSGGGGIHLHVDRGGFKHDQVLNILKFFWGNKSFIKAIAERDEKLEEWAQIKPVTDYGHIKELQKWKGGDKYSAVNFCHSKTLEFRIFNTAKQKPTIIKNMEFVSSLWDWTKEGTTVSAPAQDDYLSFVKEKDYPNLKTFLASERLI